MQNICPNPGCGAQYNLSPQHVGRQFACRKCGILLSVDAEGLKLAEGAASSVAPAPLPPQPAPAPLRSELGAHMLGAMNLDVFTWVFGAGAMLVIVFAFFPLLDQFHADRLDAKIKIEQNKQNQADNAAIRKNNPSEIDARAKERKRWIEETKPKMEEDRAAQQNEAQLNRWRDGWGMLIGFLLLGVASIAWLNPRQPPIKRVVGAIVICAEILLLFIRYTGVRFAINA